MTIRKYLQCSLRDLFWLLVVAAVMTCWWKDRTLQEGRVSKSVEAAEAQKGKLVIATKSAERHMATLSTMIEEQLVDSKEREQDREKERAARDKQRDNMDEFGRMFLGDASRSGKTYQDFDDENKELRLKVRELEKIIADQKAGPDREP